MKRLLIIAVLMLSLLAVGCAQTLAETTTATVSTESPLDFLDDCDYYLLIVVDRRDCNDGYEYIFQEDGQETTEDWFYIDELFSIGDHVLAIEYHPYGNNTEEVAFYDFD
jgi:hypothetical protein